MVEASSHGHGAPYWSERITRAIDESIAFYRTDVGIEDLPNHWMVYFSILQMRE